MRAPDSRRKATLMPAPRFCMRGGGFTLHAPPTGVRIGSESQPYLVNERRLRRLSGTAQRLPADAPLPSPRRPIESPFGPLLPDNPPGKPSGPTLKDRVEDGDCGPKSVVARRAHPVPPAVKRRTAAATARWRRSSDGVILSKTKRQRPPRRPPPLDGTAAPLPSSLSMMVSVSP